MQDVGRLAAVAVHVDGEDGVFREERLLPFGVAAVGAVGICVEQFAQGETVGGFSWRDFRRGTPIFQHCFSNRSVRTISMTTRRFMVGRPAASSWTCKAARRLDG